MCARTTAKRSWNLRGSRIDAVSSEIDSALQNFSVGVQDDAAGFGGQHGLGGAGRVSGDSDLADADQARSKVGEDRHQHGEFIVDVALGDGHVEFEFAAIRGRRLVFEVIARYLRTVDPLVEEPIQASVFLQVHDPGHVLFGDPFEGFGGGRLVAVGFDEVVHHVDERLLPARWGCT